LQRLFFDQGLPGGVKLATALAALGLEADAVGGDGAPPSGSPDKDNCQWCSEHGAVLVTHDRGKKDREILEMLDQHQVGAIVVLNEFRTKPAYFLARSLLNAEHKMDQIAEKKRLRHYLRLKGGLAPARR
jgi:hypothetical protein